MIWAIITADVEIGFNGVSKKILEGKKELKPIEDWMKMQGRFKHLFKPKRDETRLKEIQRYLEERWEFYRKMK